MNTTRKSARLFFALLPDRATQASLEYHANQFSPITGRKVSPDNFHITLLFLGNIDRQFIEPLCLACDSLDMPAFSLEIDTPGWWKKAGILWLAPSETPAPLRELHAALVNIAARSHLVNEKRDYVAHITLLRKVVSAPEYPVIKPFTWRADAFSLMESVTLPDGPRYTELASWNLHT
jgi:2'-5' RNA ligase